MTWSGVSDFSLTCSGTQPVTFYAWRQTVELNVHITPVDERGETVWLDPGHVRDRTWLIDYNDQKELNWYGNSGWCYWPAGDPTQDSNTGQVTIPFNVGADLDAPANGAQKTIGAKVQVDSDAWIYCAYGASRWHSNVKVNAFPAPERITDVVILDNTTQPPPGYINEGHDLNSGVGGDYLYFAYRKDSRYDPLTSFWVVALKQGQSSYPPQGYTWIEPGTDLNKGAGGEWIYAAQTTDPGYGPPIDQLQVEVTDNSHASPPAGWNFDGTDLNKGSGGPYIFLEWHNQPYDENRVEEAGPVRSRNVAGSRRIVKAADKD